MTATSNPRSTASPTSPPASSAAASMAAETWAPASARRPVPRRYLGPLGRVDPNSRLHWTLLILGVAASIAFNATWFLGGLLRPGYDPVVQPMSALSLGPGGWIQITNFAVFGAIGCLTALAWRATLAAGLGAMWYPRTRVLAGLAMIGAAIFSQDPGAGFPVGVPALAHPSLHAQLHNLVSYLSLTVTLAELLILARRLHREPAWRGWAPAAVTAALAMMGLLAAFGILIAHHGPGGVFEKLASLTPTLFGIALTARLLTRRDARLADTRARLISAIDPTRAAPDEYRG